MRRWMLGLSLIAVFAGTPLRLAEAADDLARSLSESDNGVNIEQIDGGVGDDSGATIKPEPASGSITSMSEQLLPAPVFLAANSLATLVNSHPIDQYRAEPADVGSRCALLQRFLC